MSLFLELDDLLDDVYSSKIEMFKPTPVGPDDVVIGNVANDEKIKAHYALCEKLNEEVRRLKDEKLKLYSLGDQESYNEVLFKLSETALLRQIATDAMWLAIKRKFKQELTGKKELVLRENWQVAYIDDKRILRDILMIASLFGPPAEPRNSLLDELNRRQSMN